MNFWTAVNDILRSSGGDYGLVGGTLEGNQQLFLIQSMAMTCLLETTVLEADSRLKRRQCITKYFNAVDIGLLCGMVQYPLRAESFSCTCGKKKPRNEKMRNK